MTEKISISSHSLESPQVKDRIAQKRALLSQLQGTAVTTGNVKSALVHQSWFNLLIAGFLGAFLAWTLIEPYFDDDLAEGPRAIAQGFLLLSSVGGLAGLFIGTTEGLLARNYSRALKSGLYGLAVGFLGGLISTFVASISMGIILLIGVMFVGEAITDPTRNFWAFFVLIVARGIAWTLAGMTVGLGPGIALKSEQMVLNGFLGGMIGALIGGVLFDPINYLVSGGTFETGVEVSRCIGLSIIGAGAGLMIGLVERVTKRAWLLMIEGPLQGKEFILFKDVTMMGSSPKCEIYLYKDEAVEPCHAKIEKIRDGYEILDNKTAVGLSVNGANLTRKKLMTGDEIKIGKVRFVYSER